MSFNWVRMKMTTRERDRQGGHEVSYIGPFDDMFHTMAPNHRKAVKKLSRKEMRREHKKIINEQLRFMDMDIRADREEELRLIQEADDLYYAELAAEFEYERDIDERYNDDHGIYDDDDFDYSYYYFDDYRDVSPYPYAAGVLSREGITRLDMNARITDQDAGKSLGDVLEEILKKRESL